MEHSLTLIWFAIIAFGVFMYVFMDGFVLGIGILFGLKSSETDRDILMNSVAPIWDGNETWLVLGGAGLFAAFPLAYAVVLPALYLPLLVMLIALVFRGVAFEFRFKAKRRWGWDLAFTLGSLLATFAQGVALGAFVQGFPVVDRQFAGGALDWLTPFSLMTGLALIFGYMLLGSTWLIIKTRNSLQRWAYQLTKLLFMVVVLFMALVSLWVPFLDNNIAQRWFSWPNIAYLSPMPLLVAACTVGFYRTLRERHEILPFVLAIALFLLNYVGLAISIWPNIIPPDISIWEAAAPPETQSFMLVGVVILIPIILGYTAYSYWIFRGKISQDMGYHWAQNPL
ncbi:MAG: cytochrome d ubiquinol oxidase subunit II [Candidatus Competibacteraceae bacterium]|nr:cytochrome d ubiquinol oxidase subunit II [Candidatus Competibacteraceae bacterium]